MWCSASGWRRDTHKAVKPFSYPFSVFCERERDGGVLQDYKLLDERQRKKNSLRPLKLPFLVISKSWFGKPLERTSFPTFFMNLVLVLVLFPFKHHFRHFSNPSLYEFIWSSTRFPHGKNMQINNITCTNVAGDAEDLFFNFFLPSERIFLFSQLVLDGTDCYMLCVYMLLPCMVMNGYSLVQREFGFNYQAEFLGTS